MAPRESVRTFMSKPAEDIKAASMEWVQWAKDHQSSIVDEGSPLNKTKRVDAKGVSDAKNEITGYTIIQAASLEAAADVLKGHPATKFENGWIEILESVPMPGI